MDEDIRELLALYALGGLSEEEQQEVEVYLAAHPEAENELRQLMAVTTSFRHVAAPVEPPSHIRENLLSQVTQDARRRAPQTAVSPPTLWQTMQNFFAKPAFGLASATLALALIVWLFLLNQQLGQIRQQVAQQQTEMNGLQDSFATMRRDNAALTSQIESLTAENQTLQQQITTLIEEQNAAQTLVANLEQEKRTLEDELTAVLAQNEALEDEVTAVQALNTLLQDDLAASTEIVALFTSPETQQVLLPGTETQPQAEGHLLFDPETNVAILFVDGLDTLAQGQVYQVLLIRDDGHDTAETFAVDVTGQQALIVNAQAPLNTFTSVGISIEPEGGSPQRTGDVILLGNLINS